MGERPSFARRSRATPSEAGGEGAPRRSVVHVAAGVVLRADGAALLADRPGGKHYAGYWEFPGGKIEDGESVEHALARELAEELGITVTESVPWVVFEFDYPHAYVRLYFRRVFSWDGVPAAVEGQRLVFHRPGAPPPAPLLPAARPVIRWLQLPNRLSWPRPPAAEASAQPREHWIADTRWLASSVRTAQDLAQAAALGADFAVAPALEDSLLADLCHEAPIPVYASDPRDPDALHRLQRLGVHGLAG
jgi:8-oxo-dGTP diphosphatase